MNMRVMRVGNLTNKFSNTYSKKQISCFPQTIVVIRSTNLKVGNVIITQEFIHSKYKKNDLEEHKDF